MRAQLLNASLERGRRGPRARLSRRAGLFVRALVVARSHHLDHFIGVEETERLAASRACHACRLSNRCSASGEAARARRVEVRGWGGRRVGRVAAASGAQAVLVEEGRGSIGQGAG